MEGRSISAACHTFIHSTAAEKGYLQVEKELAGFFVGLFYFCLFGGFFFFAVKPNRDFFSQEVVLKTLADVHTSEMSNKVNQ